jgi:hypothetical protein
MNNPTLPHAESWVAAPRRFRYDKKREEKSSAENLV